MSPSFPSSLVRAHAAMTDKKPVCDLRWILRIQSETGLNMESAAYHADDALSLLSSSNTSSPVMVKLSSYAQVYNCVIHVRHAMTRPLTSERASSSKDFSFMVHSTSHKRPFCQPAASSQFACNKLGCLFTSTTKAGITIRGRSGAGATSGSFVPCVTSIFIPKDSSCTLSTVKQRTLEM